VASSLIGNLQNLMQSIPQGTWGGEVILTINRTIDELVQQLKTLDMNMTRISAERFRAHVNIPGITVGQCRDYLNQLLDRMADETETTYLLALSPSERALYEPDKSPYGDQLETRFPASSYEIEEAGKCLALGRTTASAFHSVRCLEAAIRAIARCISIPDPIKGHERNWSAALKSRS
jgi:hypothetical protein